MPRKMTDGEIRILLSEHQTYRVLIEACKDTAKSLEEIRKLTGFSIKSIKRLLEVLVLRGVVIQTTTGWKSTETAIKVLNKYFK